MVFGPFALPKLLLVAPAAAALGFSVRMLEALPSADVPRPGSLVSKEDADAVKLKVPMPGLGKEHVKVWADQDGLMIEGEGDKDAEYDDDGDKPPARYSHRVELPADTFKMDQIKAEMKDGVLKVTVPKIKLEERKDVFQVKVELGKRWNRSVQVS